MHNNKHTLTIIGSALLGLMTILVYAVPVGGYLLAVNDLIGIGAA